MPHLVDRQTEKVAVDFVDAVQVPVRGGRGNHRVNLAAVGVYATGKLPGACPGLAEYLRGDAALELLADKGVHAAEELDVAVRLAGGGERGGLLRADALPAAYDVHRVEEHQRHAAADCPLELEGDIGRALPGAVSRADFLGVGIVLHGAHGGLLPAGPGKSLEEVGHLDGGGRRTRAAVAGLAATALNRLLDVLGGDDAVDDGHASRQRNLGIGL